MAKPPAFQFYAADFLTGTARFTAEEVGAYIRLLCYQWDSGGLLEDDIPTLSGVSMERLKRVLQKFKKSDSDGLFRNARLEKTRGDLIKFIEKQRLNGSLGGRPKKGLGYFGETQIETQKNPFEDRRLKIEDKEEEQYTLSGKIKKIWGAKNPAYAFDDETDNKAVRKIETFVVKQLSADKKKIDPHFGASPSDEEVVSEAQKIFDVVLSDSFWKTKGLSSIAGKMPEFWGKRRMNGAINPITGNPNIVF